MRMFLSALLLVSPLALAAEGSWTSRSFGGTLVHGQQRLISQPVAPASALPTNAVATRISWKITPEKQPASGLKIKLCTGSRCLPLPSLSGEMTSSGNLPAEGPWRFEYLSTVRGPMFPVLTLLSNQLSVQYRIQR